MKPALQRSLAAAAVVAGVLGMGPRALAQVNPFVPGPLPPVNPINPIGPVNPYVPGSFPGVWGILFCPHLRRGGRLAVRLWRRAARLWPGPDQPGAGADHAAAGDPGPARHAAQALRAGDVHQGQHADLHRGAGQDRPHDAASASRPARRPPRSPTANRSTSMLDDVRKLRQPQGFQRQPVAQRGRAAAAQRHQRGRTAWACSATTARSAGRSACRRSSPPSSARRWTPRRRPWCKAPSRARSIPTSSAISATSWTGPTSCSSRRSTTSARTTWRPSAS